MIASGSCRSSEAPKPEGAPARPVGVLCAWCTPTEVLEALHRAYDDLTDGICSTCEARLLAELDNDKERT